MQERTAKVVGGRVASGRGNEGGECGKDVSKEVMRCQGVTGDWHVVGGGEWASKWPRGQMAGDDDRQ